MGVLSPSASADLDAAARLLARRAMELRCGDAPAYALWLARFSGGTPLTAIERQKVDPFVQPVFGLPNQPINQDHLQGYVAELLWHTLTREAAKTCSGEGRLCHLEDPSFSVTEPGGDGLAIYEVVDGMLVFRLWEIKKHLSGQHLSTTIAGACNQLSVKGAKYLAKYVMLGKNHTGLLGQLYAALVDLWVESDPRAGLGISVATSAASAPKRRAFTRMGKAFPAMNQPGQREGLIVAIGDFGDFAKKVQEAVWSGL